MASARSAITRLILARSSVGNPIAASISLESTVRCFSDDKGRVLSEEERAKESMFIQKMEKEVLEKKKKLEQLKPGNEKESAEKKPGESKP